VAANYKVNIELDTKKLDRQLKRLKTQVEEVGKVKRGGRGGSRGGKGGVGQGMFKGMLDIPDRIQVRQFAKTINPLLNKADKIADKGGMLALPNSKMLNASVKGIQRIQTSEDKIAKFAERRASANKRSATASKDILEASKASAKAGAAYARSMQRASGVNTNQAGLGLINLAGRAGRLGGRSAALTDQQTALRQPRGLPSASMLNAESRGIQRVPTASQLLSRPTGGVTTPFITTSAQKAAQFEERINAARKRSERLNTRLIGSESVRNKQLIRTNNFIQAQNKATRKQADNIRKLGDSFGKLGTGVSKFQEGIAPVTRGPGGRMLGLPTSEMLNTRIRSTGQTGGFGKQSRFAQGIPGKSFMQSIGATQGFDVQSAIISGMFPLLFGQGPLTAAGGAIGGGVGGMFGQMGGFAGGLAGTAVVSGVVGLANSARELGEAVRSTSGTMDIMSQRSLFSSEAVEAQAKALQKQGKEAELATLLTNELNAVLGVGSVDRLKELGVKSKEMNRQFGILTTQLQLFISGPLTTFLAEINKILGRTTMFNTIDQNLKQVRTELGEGELRNRMAEIGKFTTFREELDSSILGPGPIGNVGSLGPGGILDPGMNIAGVRDMDRLSEILNISSRGLSSSKVGSSPLDPLNSVKAEESKLDALVKQTLQYDAIIMFGKEEAEIRKQIKEFEEGATEQERLQIATGKITVRQLIEQNNEAKKLADNAILVEESFKRMSETIATDIGNGIKELIRGTSTLNDVMRNVLDKMIDAALNMAIFGNTGGSFSPGLGLLGSIFRANGGPVKAGGSYVVGEQGPEVFSPSVSGMITPNHALGGSTNVVVNVDASGSSVEGDEQQSKELGRLISVAVQSELINQKRPGGILA